MICHNKIYVHEISFDAGSNYTVVQLAKFVKFTWKREKNAKYYRDKSTAWKIIRSHAAGVYDVLKGYIDGPDSVTLQIKVRTWLMEFDGVTPKRVYYEGLVKLSDCEVDADGEGITFTPTTDDDYLWYESYKGVKYNPQTIMDIDEIVTYEAEPVKRVMFNELVDPNGYNSVCSPGETLDDWLTARKYIETSFAYDDGAILGSETTWGWCRNDGGKYYKCILENTAGAGNEPTGAGNANWTRIDPPPDDYVQLHSELPFTGYTEGNGIYDTGYPAVTANVTDATNVDVGDFYKKGCTVITEEYTVATRARVLIDLAGDDGVFNQMLLEAGQSFTVVSEFFSDSPNNPVSGTANKLLNLIICTKEAIINGVDSSNQNDGLSFEQFFAMMREVFNCYWYIDGTDLIIEHLSYFEEGLSYGGSPSTGVDLTSATYPYTINNTLDANGGDSLDKYSFSGVDFPEKEVWKWAEQQGSDGYIEYTSAIVDVGKETVHNAQILTTDIELVVKFPDQVDENGWALMACDPTNIIWMRDSYKDGYYPGGTLGTLYPDVLNGELYWDNDLMDWWRYGLALTNVRIVGTVTTALSVTRSKKQEKVMFQRKEDITLTDLIITHLGNGEVDVMEIDTESDWVTVSLLYEL